MILKFINGSHVQQNMWGEALHHLLHFPFEAINLTATIDFVASISGGHTDLASTNWTYDSPISSTKVRKDAPSFSGLQSALVAEAAKWGLEFSAERFYMETAVHETAHALYAALPHARRVAIAQMFGAKSDSLSEIQPNVAWQDRIIEGIAETFKEAFLPRRFRVFPNRTNKRISYSMFPEFRALWRAAAPEVGIEEVGTVEEQMHKLEERDSLQVGPKLKNNTEEPPTEAELDTLWAEWKPAEDRGWHMAVVSDPNVAYRTVPNNSGSPHRLPKEVGAIWQGELLGGGKDGMGVVIFERSFNSHFEATITEDGEVQVFLSDQTLKSGYKLSARRTKRTGEIYTYRLRLERWDGGVPEVLHEGTVDESASGIGDLGLSAKDGVVTAWAGVPVVPIFSVNDSKYNEGYAGIGLLRDDLFTGLSEPGLTNFRAGTILSNQPGPPVEVPPPNITPAGSLGGSLPHKRPIVGNTQ
jgi:hypothetical protein